MDQSTYKGRTSSILFFILKRSRVLATIQTTLADNKSRPKFQKTHKNPTACRQHIKKELITYKNRHNLAKNVTLAKSYFKITRILSIICVPAKTRKL
jgi:hypothetical protein